MRKSRGTGRASRREGIRPGKMECPTYPNFNSLLVHSAPGGAHLPMDTEFCSTRNPSRFRACSQARPLWR
jgi:hypothetical protein